MSWQLRSRIVRGPIVVSWIEGQKLVASSGDAGVTGNIYTGLYDFEDMSFLLHALRSTDTFIDAGANAGVYSILASGVVGARSIAFEPVPATYERLLRNVVENGLNERVDARNSGLAEVAGVLTFSADEDSTNHVVADVSESSDGVTVPVERVDDLDEEEAFLLKIDVEGYELPVLTGSTNMLAGERLSGIILELNGSGQRYGHSDAEIFCLVGEYGFKPYRYDPWRRRLESLSGPNSLGKNTIFVRNYDNVASRLQNAQSFKVNGLAI